MHFFFFLSEARSSHVHLTCPYKGRGEEIQTSDLHFMRYGSQPIELPLGDYVHLVVFQPKSFLVVLRFA